MWCNNATLPVKGLISLCAVYSRARSIRRARTIRGNTVYRFPHTTIPTPLVSVLFFAAASVLFFSFKKFFFVLIPLERRRCQIAIFYFARCVRKLALYSDVILLEISRKTRWWYLKCVIVYLARDIPAFVMYCVNGESGSSLLIESTDSMIIIYITIIYKYIYNIYNANVLFHFYCIKLTTHNEFSCVPPT